MLGGPGGEGPAAADAGRLAAVPRADARGGSLAGGHAVSPQLIRKPFSAECRDRMARTRRIIFGETQCRGLMPVKHRLEGMGGAHAGMGVCDRCAPSMRTAGADRARKRTRVGSVISPRQCLRTLHRCCATRQKTWAIRAVRESSVIGAGLFLLHPQQLMGTHLSEEDKKLFMEIGEMA